MAIMAIDRQPWGRLNAQAFSLYTIRNAAGAAAVLSDHGASLVRLNMPAPSGAMADVVLGFDSVQAYRDTHTYMGATVGRFANRIRGGTFTLDGIEYALHRNEGRNTLHGGPDAYDKRRWRAQYEPAGNTVTFRLNSADGDGGFPGRLRASASYTLDDQNCLRIVLRASTDRPTLCNLAHHSYFNLAGHSAGTVLDHALQVHADFYAPIDAERMPTGEVRSVGGTAFDFREPRRIGDGIMQLHVEGSVGHESGYDHNWCLRGEPGQLRPVLRAHDPVSGRGFELATTEPCLQIYTGGYLEPRVIGKDAHAYMQYAGFALETQRFPNGPNLGHVPQSRLDRGDAYTHIMEFRFFT